MLLTVYGTEWPLCADVPLRNYSLTLLVMSLTICTRFCHFAQHPALHSSELCLKMCSIHLRLRSCGTVMCSA